MAVRDSLPVTLLPTSSINANGTGVPQQNLKGLIDMFVEFAVSAVPTGGSPVLDVWLQTSADGTTWQDIAHVQWTNVANTQFLQISGESDASQFVLAAMNQTLGAGVVIQGPWADKLQVAWQFTAGGSTGAYALSIMGYFK